MTCPLSRTFFSFCFKNIGHWVTVVNNPSQSARDVPLVSRVMLWHLKLQWCGWRVNSGKQLVYCRVVGIVARIDSEREGGEREGERVSEWERERKRERGERVRERGDQVVPSCWTCAVQLESVNNRANAKKKKNKKKKTTTTTAVYSISK